MPIIDKKFLIGLKKGDEVFVVVPDPIVRRVIYAPFGFTPPCTPAIGRVISKGRKWLSVAVGKGEIIRFDLTTGNEVNDFAYQATIWENEDSWKAHVERAKAWEELRQYMQDHREPPDVVSLSDIKSVSLALGFDKGES
ncbi:beta barrel domain-containing protein [Acetobacter persici]|uniref:Uncharacterized protein n=1 Tax=Acetobacter persici TaxID=1076596 RepID=A0A1U9LJU2_9PROT|nr:hypothetical protein [Acetobacter persici]AQT06560.1 hypothetical protein A0U91_16260 [Acetobacter persici]